LTRRVIGFLDPRIERAALRKLRQIGAAESAEDLRVPPGNRLERLVDYH
jgi:proteic killer suppression protein